jgi:predicted PhzF superfamily epimerase YddE/YHI9
MKKIRTFIIDAFTEESFKGNPAGVCLLEEALSAETMQNIAAELNLSETAFIKFVRRNEYTIRYFTPTTEVSFCGHATVASSKLLFTHFNFKEVIFTTHHHLEINASGENGEVKIQFPLYHLIEFTPSPFLLSALQLADISYCGFNTDLHMALIVSESPSAIRSVLPDYVALVKAPDHIKEVVITSPSDNPKYDFISRCFCPWIGINEDPVTGAAHTILANYWSVRLQKDHLMAYQASKRGGSMKIQIVDSNSILVTSNAVIVLEGNIQINVD